MTEVLVQILPFFALIGCGILAAKTGLFDAGAGRALTQFVFYFALSALLFRFTSTLKLSDLLEPAPLAGYLVATLAVYAVATAVAMARGLSVGVTAVEAQCAVIGNVGFMGLPMLVLLFGEMAAKSVLQVLVVDLIVFMSLIVTLFSLGRGGGRGALRTVLWGLMSNPMIMAIVAGMVWSGLSIPQPDAMAETLRILGNAATPGALFAIGVSLVGKSAERLSVAIWLSFAKLVLHPAAVAVAVFWLFPVDPAAARVIVACAALPVAGNIFILAQAYGIAPQRASTAILVSTVLSIATLTAVLTLTL